LTSIQAMSHRVYCLSRLAVMIDEIEWLMVIPPREMPGSA